MELELIRAYFPNGTNGELFVNGKRICFTIELPWNGNRPGLSCIPEGRYPLIKRWSIHHGWHLLVTAVVRRSLILVHPANDALKELGGCIAPVSLLIAEGKGLRSRMAFDKIKGLVFPELESRHPVFLIVKSTEYEYR